MTTATTTNWAAVRSEFPALANWTYLNTATYGQIARPCVEAIAAHFAHRDEFACSDFLDWYADADRMKTPIARLINAAPADIAYMQNASVALGLIAGGLDWKPGDNLVTLAGEFPNQLYLSAHVAHRGVELREAPPEQLLDSIDSRTRLVAVSEVNYSNGYRADVAQIAQVAHGRGAFLFVDGTQSTGALRIDVAKSQPDALAVHAYKWMCAPTGIGFLYIDSALRSVVRPNAIGWRSHRDWRNVDNLHHGTPEFTESAERYEGGGLSFGLTHALAAAVEMMLEIGPENIEARVLALADDARARLRKLGASVLQQNSQIVAAKFARHDPSQLARELKSRKILAAARHGYLRVSPHFYNNTSDLDQLEAELKRLL